MILPNWSCLSYITKQVPKLILIDSLLHAIPVIIYCYTKNHTLYMHIFRINKGGVKMDGQKQFDFLKCIYCNNLENEE